LSYQPRKPTVADWRPASEPPEIPEGEQLHVFICDPLWRRSTALYCQRSGAFLSMGREGLQAALNAVCWAPWPSPPSAAAIARGFKPEPVEVIDWEMDEQA
jgi:hypothetical protein